jgi:hypothetical protein
MSEKKSKELIVRIRITNEGTLEDQKEAVRKMLKRCRPVGSGNHVFFIESYEIYTSGKRV